MTALKDETAAGEVISDYGYEYDSLGNITKITGMEGGKAESLTGENVTADTAETAVISVSMTYDADNRLLTYNGQQIEYDKEGNMTRSPLNGGMADFAYDCRNRLVKVTEADGTVTLYEYDAENVRTAVTTKGIRTEYTTDRESVYSQTLVKTEYEKNPFGSYTRQTSRTVYTYGQGLVGEKQDDGKKLYYHYNHLGSTMAVTDGDGNILYRFVYDTYGELSDIRNGSGVSLRNSEAVKELTACYTLSEIASAAGIEYLYNRQYGVSTDKNGLYYMRARYYNQDIKRFINRDVVSGEITNSGSLNRYCYVQGNPVSLTDPFGLCPDSNSAFKNLCNNLYHMDWNALGHAALDVAGIFFDGADVINAIWYACEGNMEMAAASAVCAIPALGMATGNLLMKSNKLAAAGKAVKAIAKMTQGVMGVCAGIEMAKTGFTNFLDGLEAGTFDAGALLQTLGGIGIAMLSGKGLASSGRELQACEEGLSQLYNSAKSKVSKGIRDFANDNRGFVDLDALGIVKSNANQKPIGWHVGDPIDNLTRTGAEPSWSTVRSRYWKNEAYFNPDDYSESNLKLMQKGRAPRNNIVDVPMELHHKEGRNIDNPHNISNLEKVWPWDHAEKDPNRYYTGPRP